MIPHILFHFLRGQQSDWMGKNWDMPEGASSFLPGIIKLDFSSNLAYMHISSLLSAVYENIHKAQEQKLN